MLFPLSQWSLGWPGHISPWTLPGFLRTPQQGTDGEGPHLRHGEETLSWRWICTLGDVCLSHHTALWAADWKCWGAGAGSQHWFWSDYETTSVQDYHLLKVLDSLWIFWNITTQIGIMINISHHNWLTLITPQLLITEELLFWQMWSSTHTNNKREMYCSICTNMFLRS